MAEKVTELLNPGPDNKNFFKFAEIDPPKIRNLPTFRTLMRITALAPFLIALGVLLFFVVYQQADRMLLSFILGSCAISVGAIFLSRRLLVALVNSSELSQAYFRQSEEHFRLLANSIPQLVSVADGEGQALWYNDAWYRYTGSSPQETSLANWGHVHHPDYFPIVFEKWKVALETSEAFEVQFPLKGKNGTYRRFLYKATPIKDKKQKVLFWFGTATDIESEIVQIEDQQFLKEATAVLNSSLDFDTILNLSCYYSTPHLTDWGTTIFFEDQNPQNVAETETTKKENIPSLLALADWDLIEKQGFQVLHSESSENGILKEMGFSSLALFPIRSKKQLKGAYLFLLKGERAFDSRRIAILSEFAQLCTTAFENAELHENLKDAIESRDDFISVASHELKTPLTALQLQVQLLERQLKAGTAVTIENTQGLSMCGEQIRKLAYMINQLFDTTSIRLGRVQLKKISCDLSFIIKEAVKKFAPEAKAKGIEIQLGNLSPVLGIWDPVRIEQIVGNLMSNAIKYGNAKPVSISAELLENKTFARLVVRDQGVGISEAQQRKIFDRFTRASSDSSAPGLGLGLYICRQLVHAHGGRIRVKSELGEGSEFTVTLPVS